MIGAWLFLAVGFLLMVLVFFLLRRPKTSTNDLAGLPNGIHSFAGLPEEPFRQELAARLFGTEDWNFVVRQGSPPLRRVFLQQRRALALSWLRGARAHATKLIRVHRAAVRSSSQLEPLVELRITVDYVLFGILCQLIALAISLRGPVHLSRLIGYVDALSLRLSEATKGLLAAQLAGENSRR